MSPGVHSVDALTLTDTETGFCINLRYAGSLGMINGSDNSIPAL